jgi:hypothetical protein
MPGVIGLTFLENANPAEGCAAQHLSLGIAAFMRRLQIESIMTWGRAWTFWKW